MTTHYTTARKLMNAYKMFKANPDTRYQLAGIWPPEDWDFADFRAWFMECLNEKINRNEPKRGRSDTAEYRSDLAHDVRIIREYKTARIRHTGCRNILRTPEAKRLYPYINTQTED